jgi:S1-C subfamily serine protease
MARDAGASLVAIDRQHDLALLRAEAAASRPALEIEPSTEASIGEDALLFGFPLGDPVLTVSRAMIAAKISRAVTGNPPPTGLIKLDASVNKGNSGGPVIRISTGKVIGVTSLKVGSVQDRLQKLLQEKHTAETTGDGNDPIELIKAIVADMETNLQLGLGYAIATEHLLPLLATAR